MLRRESRKLRAAVVVWIFLFTGVVAYALVAQHRTSNTLCQFILSDSKVRSAQARDTAKLVMGERAYAAVLRSSATAKVVPAIADVGGKTWLSLAATQEANYKKSLTLVAKVATLKNDLSC